jgi:hypothetical protein
VRLPIPLPKGLPGDFWHEIIGLVFPVIFFTVHCIYNRKWIKQISLSMFSKKLPIRTKLLWYIDLACVLFIAFDVVSGLAVSKTFLFLNFGDMNWWKTWHRAISWFTVLPIGLHLGMHWIWIMGIFKKLLKITSNKATKILGQLIGFAAMTIGGYYFYTSEIWAKTVGGFYDRNRNPEALGIPDTTGSVVVNLGKYIPMMIFLLIFGVAIGHYVNRYLLEKNSKTANPQVKAANTTTVPAE